MLLFFFLERKYSFSFSVPFIIILIIEVFQVCNDLSSVPMLYTLQLPLSSFHPGARRGKKNRRGNDAPGFSRFTLLLQLPFSWVPLLSAFTVHLADEPGHTQECQPPSSITLYDEHTAYFKYLNSRDGERPRRKCKRRATDFLFILPFRASVLPPLAFGAYNVFCSIQNGVELNQNVLVLHQQKPRAGVLNSWQFQFPVASIPLRWRDPSKDAKEQKQSYPPPSGQESRKKPIPTKALPITVLFLEYTADGIHNTHCPSLPFLSFPWRWIIGSNRTLGSFGVLIP